MNGTKSLVESSLLTGLAVVLFLAARFIPVAGIVLSLLCPAPLVVLGLRHRPQRAALALCVATAIVGLLGGPISSVSFFLGFGILGVGLGILAARFDKAVDIMLYGIVLSLVSKLLLMSVLTWITGVNPFDPDVEELRATMTKVFSLYGGGDIDSLEGVKGQMEMTLKAIPLMFPAMITMASALDCLLSYVVSRRILLRIGGGSLPPVPSFGSWRFPKSLFWAFALSALLLVFESSIKDPLLSRVGLNLRLLVSMLFMIQGMAVGWDYMDFRGVGKGWRYALVTLAVLIPLLSQVAVIAGLLDIWIDLRKRYRR
ncbi:YybS family protein [Dethiosulfovibrio sp. F2B]|uniref:YybS family protein n=1 Tax=Dethiosulfovibrio faecalis TaxID=2720018 RepID=UPI001F333899|nr:YybS family protein [Dethiosulfovibrio faecalis]MCF4150743.1 YybS family protein [Dethiosulfovibrio faecalis]